jgi:hypothetical protein
MTSPGGLWFKEDKDQKHAGGYSSCYESVCGVCGLEVDAGMWHKVSQCAKFHEYGAIAKPNPMLDKYILDNY